MTWRAAGAAEGPHTVVAMPARLALVVSRRLAGCGPGYRTTLLTTAGPGAPPLEYHVEIPTGYDVLAVDYDAALVGIASGENTSTRVAGKGVVSVHAVERVTGAEVVLVYDDVPARRTPTAIIRLDRAE